MVDGRIQLKYLLDAYKLFPGKDTFFLKNNFINTLAGHDQLQAQVKQGKTEAEIRKSWEPTLNNFKKIRQKYLLYKDFTGVHALDDHLAFKYSQPNMIEQKIKTANQYTTADFPLKVKTGPRIIFMGTPEFAVASLDKLLQAGSNIIGVITAPDKPGGRGMELQQSAVKKYALEKGLHILQPEKLKNPDFLT
jgi:hypothetical protein